MSEGESRGKGLAGSVRGLFETAVAAVETRVELFAVECHEERVRLVEVVLLAGAVVALGMTALGLITLAIVLLFSGNARLIAVAVFGFGYLGAAGWVYSMLSARLKNWAPFSGTVAEIRKDREWLQGKR